MRPSRSAVRHALSATARVALYLALYVLGVLGPGAYLDWWVWP